MKRPPAKPAPRVARGGSLYRGTALLDAPPQARAEAKPKGPRRGTAHLPVLVALAVVGLATGGWLGRHAVGRGVAALGLGKARVTVSGTEYLAPEEVREASGLPERVPFFRVDLDRARAKLLRHRRVRDARLSRRLDGEVRVEVSERVPAALALYGRPLEVAADGVVLPPLVGGVLPDLPVVTGLAAPSGQKVKDPDWARAVRWVRRLADPALALDGRVSEIDVSRADVTRVVLAPDGARLLLPAEAKDADGLAALRVVLADLEARGVRAATIDCRARGLAVVSPVTGSIAPSGSPESAGGAASVPRATHDDSPSGPGPERRRG